MSILINGMEMPKNCGDCKAFVCYRQWAGDVGDCFCGITKNDAEAKKKNADCPLVEIPPHGRLIDADARVNVQMYNDEFEDFQTVNMSIDDLLDSSWIELEDDPTIIPAEEGE